MVGSPVLWPLNGSVPLSMICERLVADTMPVATDCSSPKGLPMVMTHSPMMSSSESPTSMGARPLASFALMTAKSELGSVPTISASYCSPPTVTLSASAPSTTWLFVMM